MGGEVVSDKPVISVITATWQRHIQLFNRCIPSVERQTYPNVEHIIVSDGPDPQLSYLRERAGHWRVNRIIELGRNHQAIQEHWGAIPRLVGAYVARGDLIAYLDDDNEYMPWHLERLAREFEQNPKIEIAYSQMDRYVNGTRIDTIGDDILELGHIDTSLILHKPELLWHVANWRAAGYCSDWDLIERWRDAGMLFKFVPEVTVRWHR